MPTEGVPKRPGPGTWPLHSPAPQRPHLTRSLFKDLSPSVVTAWVLGVETATCGLKKAQLGHSRSRVCVSRWPLARLQHGRMTHPSPGARTSNGKSVTPAPCQPGTRAPSAETLGRSSRQSPVAPSERHPRKSPRSVSIGAHEKPTDTPTSPSWGGPRMPRPAMLTAAATVGGAFTPG